MNHWLECIDIWHGTSLGQGDSSLFNKLPGVTNGYAQRGHIFKKAYIAKHLKIFFS